MTGAFSILVADDDAGCRASVKEILDAEGYRTVVASSGEEALYLVRREVFHLSMLDWHMQDMTGAEVLLAMRGLPRAFPCVIMTSDESAEVSLQAKASGVVTILYKPLRVAQVRGVVRGYVLGGSLL